VANMKMTVFSDVVVCNLIEADSYFNGVYASISTSKMPASS
jgi:hypothetical protein